jgi:hypothetical protein
VERGQLRQLEKRGARIQEPVDPVTRDQFAWKQRFGLMAEQGDLGSMLWSQFSAIFANFRR